MSRGPSRARQLGYILPASSSCRVVWPRRDPSSRARLINWTMDAALQRRSESDSQLVVPLRHLADQGRLVPHFLATADRDGTRAEPAMLTPGQALSASPDVTHWPTRGWRPDLSDGRLDRRAAERNPSGRNRVPPPGP